MRLLPRLVTLLTGVFAAPFQAQVPARQEWIESTVPRMATAADQLAHARRIKRQSMEQQGPELTRWRELAVEAYQAVRRFHPEAREACVEAAFRAGEILRAQGASARARAEFDWCVRHGEHSDFRARARLEIGHLLRRERRWSEALEAFLDVAADGTALAERRDEAWLWAGRAWQAQGRTDDACAAWRRVAEHGSEPVLRIEAYDELCLVLCACTDLEGAAGVLDECSRALASRALEETETGVRVRNALARMRILDELPRAIASRRRARLAEGSPRKP